MNESIRLILDCFVNRLIGTGQVDSKDQITQEGFDKAFDALIMEIVSKTPPPCTCGYGEDGGYLHHLMGCLYASWVAAKHEYKRRES